MTELDCSIPPPMGAPPSTMAEAVEVEVPVVVAVVEPPSRLTPARTGKAGLIMDISVWTLPSGFWYRSDACTRMAVLSVSTMIVGMYAKASVVT